VSAIKIPSGKGIVAPKRVSLSFQGSGPIMFLVVGVVVVLVVVGGKNPVPSFGGDTILDKLEACDHQVRKRLHKKDYLLMHK
jgi:hypothetical protein